MLDFDILNHFGTTNDKLKEVLTAAPGSCHCKHRKELEDRIESRVYEGVAFNLKSYQMYAASDLAWDGHVITKEVVPLMQYAQGKIDVRTCEAQLSRISPKLRDKFCTFDDKKQVTGVNIAEFHKVWVNLVRSFITRRRATMTVRYTSQVPFLKYEPHSTAYTARLKADVLSQRVEMVVNQHNFRHEFDQIALEELLYGHTVAFPSRAWGKEYSYRKTPPVDGVTPATNKPVFDAYIEREGFSLTRPHPSRVFWDNAFPLASINADNGAQYIGFWDIVRYGDIHRNTAYFNRSEIEFNTRWNTLFDGAAPFFELYYPDAPINMPTGSKGGSVAQANDRANLIGVYNSDLKDSSVVLTEYREKLIPRDCGFGDYPFPVWVRFVVAGVKTVIFAEILPSLPAFYFGYNENDNRQLNTAFAHEIMPWQDQVSNLLTQLLYTQKQGLIKILSVNTDLMDDDQKAQFKRIVEAEDYYTKMLVIPFSGAKAADLGLESKNLMNLEETNTLDDISTFFGSLLKILELAERVLNFSPQELGQPAPREISATESTMIENTTNAIYDFLGVGLDEGLSAMKKCLYESFIALGSEEVYVPVLNRYTKTTIEAAGFKMREESEESDPGSGLSDSAQTDLLGNKQSLVYDYVFSTRGQTGRASNARTAEVMVQLLAQIVQIPGLLQELGKERLYQFLNAIVRASGAPVDLRFERAEGESDAMPDPNQVDDREQFKAAIAQVMQRVQANEQATAQVMQALQQPEPAAPAPAAPAAPAPAAPAAPSLLELGGGA